MQNQNVVPLNVVDIQKQRYAKLYVQALQAINAYWMPVLHSTDASVLHFIVERTLRWGKVAEVIPYSHMIEGVYSGDECIQGRVNVSRPTIFRVMRRLEDWGFISVSRVKSTHRGFEANRIEINFKLIIDRDMSKLKESRKPPKVTVPPCIKLTLPLVSKHTPPLYQNSTTNIHKENTQKLKIHKEEDADASSSPESVITRSRERTDLAKQRRAGAVPTTATINSLRALWQVVMLEYYPRVPVIAITAKEASKFKKGAALNLPGIDWRDFFNWLVGSWPALRGGKLAWLNRKSEVMTTAPSLSVVANYFKAFAREYSNHLMEATLNEDRIAARMHNEDGLALAKARAIIAKQGEEVDRLRQKLRRTRVRVVPAPAAPASPNRPMTQASLDEAETLYNDDTPIGRWK